MIKVGRGTDSDSADYFVADQTIRITQIRVSKPDVQS